MLTSFPDLLYLGILAPTILRIAAGTLFISLALTHWTTRETVRRTLPLLLRFARRISPELVIFAELVIGALLLIGLFTQIAALLALAWVIKALLLRSSYPALFPLGASSYVLLGAIVLTLIITGAGAFAFDLPL